MFGLSEAKVRTLIEDAISELRKEIEDKMFANEELAEKLLSTETSARIIGEYIEMLFHDEEHSLESRIQAVLDNAVIDIRIK